MKVSEIEVAIGLIKERAEELDSEISEMRKGTQGCPNCGFLTQENIDYEQQVQFKISELQELLGALDKLEERIQ